MICKTSRQSSDKEINTLLNDTILVSLRYFFNVQCQIEGHENQKEIPHS